MSAVSSPAISTALRWHKRSMEEVVSWCHGKALCVTGIRFSVDITLVALKPLEKMVTKEQDF